MTTETLTTPRTAEEVQAMIDGLIQRKAKIEADTVEYMRLIPNMYSIPHTQFWAASSSVVDATKELQQIEDQIRVLYWVIGKYEHFPVV